MTQFALVAPRADRENAPWSVRLTVREHVDGRKEVLNRIKRFAAPNSDVSFKTAAEATAGAEAWIRKYNLVRVNEHVDEEEEEEEEEEGCADANADEAAGYTFEDAAVRAAAQRVRADLAQAATAADGAGVPPQAPATVPTLPATWRQHDNQAKFDARVTARVDFLTALKSSREEFLLCDIDSADIANTVSAYQKKHVRDQAISVAHYFQLLNDPDWQSMLPTFSDVARHVATASQGHLDADSSYKSVMGWSVQYLRNGCFKPDKRGSYERAWIFDHEDLAGEFRDWALSKLNHPHLGVDFVRRHLNEVN